MYDSIETIPRRRPPIGRLLVLVVLVVLAALVAACAGSSGANNGVVSLASSDPGASASPSASMEPRDAVLAYARCMREHGVDMPDPEFDDSNGNFKIGVSIAGKPGDKQKMDEAQEACGHFLQGVGFGNGNGGEVDQEMQDKVLAYARCMREHGVDMPDPQFDGGAVRIGGDEGNVDPNSKAFQEAHAACQSLLPAGKDGPSTQTGPGGGSEGGGGKSSGNTGPTTEIQP